MPAPAKPKIYRICHFDRLPPIIADGSFWCDAEMARRGSAGTNIGMDSIKARRLTELTLTSHPKLHVGDCVPFYFCSRSVMLYLIHKANHPELEYRGGQGPIVHLEADLHEAVAWAEARNRRWAFTLSNAGSYHFEDRSDLAHLDEIDWDAVGALNWRKCSEGKQAEFLIEREFPWELVSRIGVASPGVSRQVSAALRSAAHKPCLEIIPEWYYT